MGFPSGSDSKKSACSAGDPGSIPGSGRSPGAGNGNLTPGLLAGESHGQRGQVGYSPWGRRESDMTGRPHSFIGFHSLLGPLDNSRASSQCERQRGLQGSPSIPRGRGAESSPG